jgi:hypothetical protein
MWGRYASRRGEARYPGLWDGRVAAWCPSVTGPTGTRLYDLQFGRYQGTLTNMDPPTDWVRTTGPYALDIFDTQYVDLGTLNGLAFSGPFAMSCWVRNMTSSGVDFSPFGKLQEITGYPGVAIVIGAATNAVATAYWNNATRATGTTIVTQRADWTQIGIGWTGTQAQVIVNGRVEATASVTTAPSAGGSVASIGRYARSVGDRCMRGQIDDCAMWTRALSAGEWRLLSRRRGIAYEARRQDFGGSGFQSAWARRQGQIIGGGV